MRLMRQSLPEIVTARLSQPVPAAIAALADAARAQHPRGVLAVLAYGSCLRGIDPKQTLADLYVLTERTSDISGNIFSRLGCRILPPNVYYLEADFEGERYRAKYAALPLTAFESWVGPGTDNPYFWARFSQPSALVWVRDEEIRDRVTEAVVEAVKTMTGEAVMLGMHGSDEPTAVWTAVLRETYQTELRSESPDRGISIVAADEDWYRQTLAALRDEAQRAQFSSDQIARRWSRRRRRGKVLAALRLIKAAFTFQGGADYLAWKIERHSKVPVELTDWQRRHPLLAAISLVPQLYRKGGFK